MAFRILGERKNMHLGLKDFQGLSYLGTALEHNHITSSGPGKAFVRIQAVGNWKCLLSHVMMKPFRHALASIPHFDYHGTQP